MPEKINDEAIIDKDNSFVKDDDDNPVSQFIKSLNTMDEKSVIANAEKRLTKQKKVQQSF